MTNARCLLFGANTPWYRLLGEHRPHIEISTAIGQLEAVRSGAGIGVLHDFMAAGRQELVRLFPERVVTRAYWSVWHENMHATRRVRAAVEMLDMLVCEDLALFDCHEP